MRSLVVETCSLRAKPFAPSFVATVASRGGAEGRGVVGEWWREGERDCSLERIITAGQRRIEDLVPPRELFHSLGFVLLEK